MDYEELDEAEQKRRKAEAVEFRNKKRNSTIFLLIATVFSIIETLIIILALFVVVAFVYFKLLGIGSSDTGMTVFAVLLILIFIGGIVLGHLVYVKVVRAVLKKESIRQKVSDDLLRQYKTKKEILEEKKNSSLQ